MAPHKARGSSVSTSRVGAFFCHLSDKKLKFLGNRQLNMKTYYWKEVSENHMMINDLLDKGTLSGHNETINKQN